MIIFRVPNIILLQLLKSRQMLFFSIPYTKSYYSCDVTVKNTQLRKQILVMQKGLGLSAVGKGAGTILEL